MPLLPTLSNRLQRVALLSVGLLGSSLLEKSLAGAERWDSSMEKFAQSDIAHPPAPNAVVFTGSSSILKWTSLQQDFAGIPVLNRGFGGSELSDSVIYFNQVVLAYHPKLVVLYAGDNDLNAKKSAETVADEFVQFCAKLHATLPACQVIFISIKPSPSRWRLHAEIEKANALIAAFCAKDPRRTFVDIYPAMLGANGEPKPEIFVEDKLHMRPEGYAIWTKIIRPVVMEKWQRIQTDAHNTMAPAARE